MMTQDPTPAVYLQRPCYHSQYNVPPCEPYLWTHGRYSETVVSSLEAAIEALVAERRPSSLTLIGYSGGGVLAYLLAARVESVQALVTIAANLDTEAWADHHGYEPLLGSLSPATEPVLPTHIHQSHWVGGRDLNVPPALIESVLRNQPNARLNVVPELDHACCWGERWPEMLRQVVAASRP